MNPAHTHLKLCVWEGGFSGGGERGVCVGGGGGGEGDNRVADGKQTTHSRKNIEEGAEGNKYCIIIYYSDYRPQGVCLGREVTRMENKQPTHGKTIEEDAEGSAY